MHMPRKAIHIPPEVAIRLHEIAPGVYKIGDAVSRHQRQPERQNTPTGIPRVFRSAAEECGLTIHEETARQPKHSHSYVMCGFPDGTERSVPMMGDRPVCIERIKRMMAEPA